MAVEVESLLQVGVSLAKVAERKPHVKVVGNVVLRVEFNEYLRYLLHNHVVGINRHLLSVAEGHTCIIVLVHRFLIGEQSVQGEVLERLNFGCGSPAQCLDIIDEQHGFAFACAGLCQVLLVDVVRLGNVGYHRREVNPLVLVVDAAAHQGYGHALVLFGSRTGAGIVADARVACGHSTVGHDAKAFGHVVGYLRCGSIVQLVLGHVGGVYAVCGGHNIAAFIA